YPEFPVVRRVLSRKRIDMLLEAGEVQAFALNNAKFVAPELRSDCLFTTPLWTTSDHLLVRRARAGEITGPEDLHGRTVGTIRGYGYGEFESVLARTDVQRVEANDQASNLRMLAAGRVDAVIISRHTTPGCLARAGLDEWDFVLLEPPVVNVPLSVQVLAERRDFYEALESFVLESQANGFLLELERTAPCPGQE
ncbi:MAG: substrate-binding periplasmic protein, partial [Desulfovibrionaceae bacterium]